MKEKTLTLSRETLRQLDNPKPGGAAAKPRPAAECDTTSWTTWTRTR